MTDTSEAGHSAAECDGTCAHHMNMRAGEQASGRIAIPIATPYIDDIPFDLAKSAHSGTSFVPEDRAKSERANYAATLANDYVELRKLADTDAKIADLDREFPIYRERYRTRYVAYLGARSRCMSTMITGGANFPVRRQAKLGHTADRRGAEVIEYRKHALGAIRRILTPESQPIMAGDGDALARLDAKIATLEATQALMVACNKAIRLKRNTTDDAKIAAMVALGLGPKLAAELLTPDFAGRIGFADYQIKNNNQNIRANKARRDELAVAKAQPDAEIAGSVARFEDSPTDNRVRVYFAGKPDVATRARLKSCGFRWAPTIGAWQAYRNPRSIETAKREAGVS